MWQGLHLLEKELGRSPRVEIVIVCGSLFWSAWTQVTRPPERTAAVYRRLVRDVTRA